MRIALITLAVAALAFIVGIIWIFAQKSGINLTPPSTNSFKISDDAANIEMLKSQWKNEERLKVLEEKIDALSKNTGTLPTPDEVKTPQTSASGSATGSSTVSEKIVPISAKFLSKIIQKVTPALEKNNGIFGLYIFDNSTEYSTYTDPKYQMTIVATRVTYDTWKKNFATLDTSIYTTNPAPGLPFPSFFVNPATADASVRLVMQVETQTLFITLPKTKYNEFKTLLNKK